MLGNWRQFFSAVFLIVFPAGICLLKRLQGIDPSLMIDQFDVFNDGDFLVVPVNVFGRIRQFFVDTGASISCYDQRLRANLGKSTRTATASMLYEKSTIKLFPRPFGPFRKF